MIVEVTNRKNHTSKYRRKFHSMGMTFRLDEKKWYLATDDKERIKRIKWFCRRHGIDCVVYPQQAARSDDYRTQFFAHYPPDKYGQYRCAYCFARLDPSDAQIDHIIPVDIAKRSVWARRWMKILGYDSVNDCRNLACSCPKCNMKKGADTGFFWFIRGHLGKCRWFLYVRTAVGILLIAALTALILFLVFPYL